LYRSAHILGVQVKSETLVLCDSWRLTRPEIAVK